MKMTYMRLSLFYRVAPVLLMALLSACAVEDTPAWDSGLSAYAQFSSDTEIIYSFAGCSADITDAVVDIPLTLHLDPSVGDREIWVEVACMPSNAMTRIECPSTITIRQGDTSAMLSVKLYRTPNLAEEPDAVELRIVDSPTIKAGIPDHRVCRLVITDRFVQPQWWGDEYDEYYNPVGPCNELKLKLWYEVFGNFDDPRRGGRAWTGADAVIALATINEASFERYGKPFHELSPTDVPLN